MLSGEYSLHMNDIPLFDKDRERKSNELDYLDVSKPPMESTDKKGGSLREEKLRKDRERKRLARAQQSENKKRERLTKNKQYKASKIQNETEEEREKRLAKKRLCEAKRRQN